MARPKDDAVVQRMLDLAETLYAERGIDGVSLREISSGAGSGNSTAVQYHFGDADGLIGAILRRRMPQVDAERAELLKTIEAEGRSEDVDALMHVLFLPMFGHFNDGERRSHARFVLSLLNSRQAHIWGKMFHDLQPTAVHVLRLLAVATQISPILLFERQRLIAIMVLTSIFNRTPHLLAPELDATLVTNALSMATAAVTAPAGDDAALVALEDGEILLRGFRGNPPTLS